MARNGSHNDEKSNGHTDSTNGVADGHTDSVIYDDDVKWEKNFKRIEKLEVLFQHLPASSKQVEKVFKICQKKDSVGEYDKNYVGPLVLAKEVPTAKFYEWLRQEWGLHKSIRLDSGTVYIPQACFPDHGRIRGAFHRDSVFPILLGFAVETGSGAVKGKNPDVFWQIPDQTASMSSVVVEVGISQSLASLRRRAFQFCADDQDWVGLKYVILVKRFGKRIYVEVWRPAPAHHADDVDDLVGNMADPSIDNLGLGGTMSFVCAAHAAATVGFRKQ